MWLCRRGDVGISEDFGFMALVLSCAQLSALDCLLPDLDYLYCFHNCSYDQNLVLLCCSQVNMRKRKGSQMMFLRLWHCRGKERDKWLFEVMHFFDETCLTWNHLSYERWKWDLAEAQGSAGLQTHSPAPWREHRGQGILEQFFGQGHRWCFRLRLSWYPGMLFSKQLSQGEGRCA